MILNFLISSLGKQPAFVLRNINEDAKQLDNNFKQFEQESRDAGLGFPFGLQFLGRRDRSRAQFVVYVALANPRQLKKIRSLRGDLCLVIDEIDTVDSVNTAQKVQILTDLKQLTSLVIGVSATIMDALIPFALTR